jgi:catechol 1,2-dioxygenase
VKMVGCPGDAHIDTVQFGVTEAMLGDFVHHEEPHRTDAVAPWYSLDYTYVMEPGEGVLPRPPIE